MPRVAHKSRPAVTSGQQAAAHLKRVVKAYRAYERVTLEWAVGDMEYPSVPAGLIARQKAARALRAAIEMAERYGLPTRKGKQA